VKKIKDLANLSRKDVLLLAQAKALFSPRGIYKNPWDTSSLSTIKRSEM